MIRESALFDDKFLHNRADADVKRRARVDRERLVRDRRRRVDVVDHHRDAVRALQN